MDFIDEYIEQMPDNTDGTELTEYAAAICREINRN